MASHWKIIQQRTFTNWFNDRLKGNLKVAESKVDDLETDLADGIHLISLLEELAKPRKVGRWNRKPKNKLQCIENIGIALRFIYSENIKLVNIGPEDINGCNLKLILGLVWTLISHYQIRSSGRGLSTKEAMKQWLHTLIPEHKVENFTTDWNNGKALCGLVDQLKPGLCTNHLSLNPSNGLENCQMGMELAEKHLDIPMVMKPRDLNNPKVDDLSVMTYISYFFKPALQQLLSWINQKIPQCKVSNLSTDWNNGIALAALMDACHPGLFPEWKYLDPHSALENLQTGISRSQDQLRITCPVNAKELSNPKVDEIVVATYLSRFKHSKLLARADKISVRAPFFPGGAAVVNHPIKLDINLGLDPHVALPKMAFTASNAKKKEPVTVNQDGKGNCTAEFTPKEPGTYTMSCKYHDEEVGGSPFTILVIDPEVWSIVGDPPNVLHVEDSVSVRVKGVATKEPVPFTCTASDDYGASNCVKSTIHNGKRDSFTVSLQATETGSPVVHIMVAGFDVHKSPFTMRVCNSAKCHVSDLSNSNHLVGEPVTFTIDAADAGNASPAVKPRGPKSRYSPSMEDNIDGTFTVTFTPSEAGLFEIPIAFGGREIPGSPFSITVVNPRHWRITSDIPRYLQVGKDKMLKVSGDSAGSASRCLLSITDEEGDPSKILRGRFKPNSTDSSSSTLVLTPRDVGKAKVAMQFAGVDIGGSPFKVSVCDASACSVTGIDSQDVQLGDPIEFQIQTNGAGSEKPVVQAQGPTAQYRLMMEEDDGGVFTVTFTPKEMGSHNVPITYGDEHIPGSPFSILVINPKQCKILSSVPQFLQVGIPKELDISGGSNPSLIACTVTDKYHRPLSSIKCLLKPTEEPERCCLTLIASEIGKAQIHVKIRSHDLQHSPFTVTVCDASKCYVSGLNLDNVQVGIPVTFALQTSKAGEDTPLIKPTGPTVHYQPRVVDQRDGGYKISFTPREAGPHQIPITFGEAHVPGSPFTVMVLDLKQCKILSNIPKFVQVGKPETLQVSSGSTLSEITATTSGPDDKPSAAVKCLLQPTDDPVVNDLILTPTAIGKVTISVKIGDHHFQKSPFDLIVCDSSKCYIIGLDLENSLVGEPVTFELQTVGAGEDVPIVKSMGPTAQYTAEVHELGEGRYSVSFTPWEAGLNSISVLFGGTAIPGSPFEKLVESTADAGTCSATGPGLVGAVATMPAHFTITAPTEGLTQKENNEALMVAVQNKSHTASVTIEEKSRAIYTVTYIAPDEGDYAINISLYGLAIPGSPFEVHVFPKPNPSKCRAYGPALHPNAVLAAGRNLDFCVDTKKAGTGELQIVVQGPQKIVPKVFAAEDDRVHTVKVETSLSGWYVISILWSQIHIPKSPFKLRVHGRPDASKVKAFGVGLSQQIDVGRPANFTILTRNAGMGTLLVMVRGVKDAFKVEVNPEDESDPRTLVGEYNPKEAGEYAVTIRWSGTDIPGSPFPVIVVDREKEEALAATEARLSQKAAKVHQEKKKQEMLRQQQLLMQAGYPLSFYPGYKGAISGLVPAGGSMVATKHTKKIMHMQKATGHSRHVSVPVMPIQGVHKPKKVQRMRSSSAVESKMQSNAERLSPSNTITSLAPGYVGHPALVQRPRTRPPVDMRGGAASPDPELPLEKPVKYMPVYVATGDIPDLPVKTKSKKKKGN